MGLPATTAAENAKSSGRRSIVRSLSTVKFRRDRYSCCSTISIDRNVDLALTVFTQEHGAMRLAVEGYMMIGGGSLTAKS